MELKLKDPNLKGGKSLHECIYKRKSIRKFQNKKIEKEKLSQLIWAAQGIKNNNRTAPSAGATYPLEIYVLIKSEGLFHYNIRKHKLEKVIDEKISAQLAQAALNQTFINEAPLNVIICADYSRTCNRYGNRGVRYVHIEVGHCAQNIHLEAISLGLGSVPIGAFKDEMVRKILKLSEDIDPLYIIPIGYPIEK